MGSLGKKPNSKEAALLAARERAFRERAERRKADMESASAAFREDTKRLAEQAQRTMRSAQEIHRVTREHAFEITGLIKRVKEAADQADVAREYLALSEQAKQLFRKLEMLRGRDRSEKMLEAMQRHAASIVGFSRGEE